MPGAADWQNLPNSVTDAIQQQQTADDWAKDQNVNVAQDWANTQNSIPTPSDSLTNPLGTGNAPAPSPDLAAGASGLPSSEQSVGAPPPSAPAPAASPAYPAPNAPLPSNFLGGTPAPSAPVTAPLTPPANGGTPRTTAELSGGGAFQGFDTNANALMSWAGDQVRQQYGDDAARAVQSVLATEGGLSGARGDHGNSFGPLQFFRGGELADYANSLGVSQDQAGQYAEQHPQEAIQWALNGYLGGALQRGLQQGLTGADLATFIQRNGQRSVSPERAGQWYNTLFANGQDPFSQPITAGAAGASGITGPAQRTSQFAMGLSSQDAYAFCGPAAAIAFAQTYGRNPTVAEAKQLAQEVGWNPDQGMAGVTSEQALLSKMGVQTKLEQNINWDHVASDANAGNPVIIDTPGHYFYVTGARQGPNGEEFNVGTSGTDLRAGSQWMTASQMAQTMGSPRAALYADHPLAQGPSVAEDASQPGNGPDLGSFAQGVKGKVGDLLSAVQDVGNSAGSAIQDFAFNGPIGATRNAVQGATNYVLSGQAKSDLAQNLADNPIPGAPGLNVAASTALKSPTVADNIQTLSDLIQKYPPVNNSPSPNFDAMTPEDRQRWNQASVAVGGIVGGEGAQYDQYGVEQGFTPPNAKTPPPAPVPETSPANLAAPDLTRLEPEVQASIGETQPVQQPASDTIQGLQQMAQQRGISAAGEAPPPEQFDQQGNLVARNGQPVATAAPMQNVTPQGTLAPGVQNLPGRAGGAEPPTMPRSQQPGMVIRGGGEPEPIPADSLPNIPGVTPQGMQDAYQWIDQRISDPQQADAAKAQLDSLVQTGDAGAVARFMANVEGRTVTPTSLLRTLRTGSMAGGISSLGKVVISPIVQTAMRAPVGALRLIAQGRAGDIPTALQGGLAGLAEGAQDALQTMRYGIPMRAALSGGAQGGYGFAPGLDVLGSNTLQRTAGTALTGLVRTHGAVADISAGIGRGANAALGATPEQAAEAGQQWALRSGEYGTIGKAVANAIEGLRQTNPALDVTGQILIPFYRVGYNAVTQGVERSPLGLAGRVTDAIQGKPFDTGKLMNNMFGVGLASIAFGQAAQGNITGERPANGAPAWSVRVPEQGDLGPLEGLAKRDTQGNLWVPLRSLGPAGESLAQAASLYEAARDGQGDVAKMAQDTASEYVSHVLDDTWLSGLNDAFKTLGDVVNLNNPNKGVQTQAQRDLGYQGGGYVHSVIPQYALGSQLAKGASGVATIAAPKAGTSTSTRPARTDTRPTRPKR